MALIEHLEERGRIAHLINLDPAAEDAYLDEKEGVKEKFGPSKDIRDLICVDDVMEELQYGPNGGLMFCLEHLLENSEWLTEDLGVYQDEFLIIDCPGQIELYTHSPIMQRIVRIFQIAEYKPCAIYLMESLFMNDIGKFFAGCLTATSCMLQLGIPHLNVISKMDLIVNSENVDYDDSDDLETHPLRRYLNPDPTLLEERLTDRTPPSFRRLNSAIVGLIDELDMVSFIPLNIKQEDSLDRLLMHIENATQYSEALEPKESKDDADEST